MVSRVFADLRKMKAPNSTQEELTILRSREITCGWSRPYCLGVVVVYKLHISVPLVMV
jgi:hypothetical protein